MRELRYIKDYYAEYDEKNRLGSQRGQVEFLTTMRYIEKYLKPGMKILEIGAATGRYSHTLARAGYEVDGVELVESNIEIFKENTEAGEKVNVFQGDALDLSQFGSEAYDIVLLLGPLYHLYNIEDKLTALSEALRVLKPGGVLFSAYVVADAVIFEYGFQDGYVFELIEKGLLDTETFKASSNPEELFEICRKEDIDELMAEFETERLHYVATDLFTNHMRECVDGMDKKTFEMYLKYHFSICERQDMVGITHHSLDIVRKKQ